MATRGEADIKSTPVLRDLLKELDSIVSWQLLMINMGMEKFENDKTERNFPSDINRQKEEAFEKWLKMKPNACWKNVIDALYKMKEITLASSLAKKYAWNDPRVYVKCSFLSAARITAKKIGDIPCRKFLPKLTPGLEYYTLKDESVQPINKRSAAARAADFSHRLLSVPRPHSLADFFKSIEESNSKGDFIVGLEARFGHLYVKMYQKDVPHVNSEWMRSKVLQKRAFNTQVEEADLGKLFIGRELLVKEVTKVSVKFIVQQGQYEGIYSAAIAMYESGESDLFHLDAVYREGAIDKRARLDIALPGRKYDLRISDCSECILLAEHENSIPYQVAHTITKSICRLPGRKLYGILRGSSPNDGSTWRVKYIRQRVQRQYKWKPEKKWILAQYDVNILDYDINQVFVDSAPLNEGVDIEFDYSRKEVELWAQKIYPRNVNGTHPSREKYYYIQGTEGVRLSGGELREPYNWTTEGLLRDFEEFLGDAFKIAHILDGSPY